MARERLEKGDFEMAQISTSLRNDEYDRDIQINLILPELRVQSIKQLYEALASHMAPHLDMGAMNLARLLMSSIDHENYESTNGVLVPDLKIAGIYSSFTAFARLSAPIKSENGDEIDLVCILISPQSETPKHLRKLSRISRLFQDTKLCERLRETEDIGSIRALIASPDGWMMAAA